MKKVALSTDEELIEQARLVARPQRRTCMPPFREWLMTFTAQSRNPQQLDALMRRLGHVKVGRTGPVGGTEQSAAALRRQVIAQGWQEDVGNPESASAANVS